MADIITFALTHPFIAGVAIGGAGFGGSLGILGWCLGYEAATRKFTSWMRPKLDEAHGDMAETLKRSLRLLGGTGIRERIIEVSFAIGRAALRRRIARVKSEAKNPDPAWGGR